MAEITIPFSIADDTKTGSVVAIAAANETVVNLNPGYYKIAAIGEPLLWKTGAVAITQLIGSYLGAGDQEIIKLKGTAGGPQVPLRFINSANATADGSVNIVEVELSKIPGSSPNGNYDID